MRSRHQQFGKGGGRARSLPGLPPPPPGELVPGGRLRPLVQPRQLDQSDRIENTGAL
ncbi:hypothetical protein SALBM311S_01142 [Streptomyces alboniger]